MSGVDVKTIVPIACGTWKTCVGTILYLTRCCVVEVYVTLATNYTLKYHVNYKPLLRS